jgi:hypothetical protein
MFAGSFKLLQSRGRSNSPVRSARKPPSNRKVYKPCSIRIPSIQKPAITHIAALPSSGMRAVCIRCDRHGLHPGSRFNPVLNNGRPVHLIAGLPMSRDLSTSIPSGKLL